MDNDAVERETRHTRGHQPARRPRGLQRLCGRPAAHRRAAAFGADWAGRARARRRAVGSEEVQLLARQANRHPPELRTHDRFGHRIDVVEFHPAYHELMALIFEGETHSFAWAHPGAGCPRRARRAELSLEPGRERHLLPDGDDLRRDCGAGTRSGHPRPLAAIIPPAYDPRPIHAGRRPASRSAWR